MCWLALAGYSRLWLAVACCGCASLLQVVAAVVGYTYSRLWQAVAAVVGYTYSRLWQAFSKLTWLDHSSVSGLFLIAYTLY